MDLEIRRIKDEVLARNKLKTEKAEVRNLIFVGPSRVGKTTVFSTLCNPTHIAGKMSLFRGTVSPRMFPFCLEVREDNTPVLFNINIIDTPGLFERTEPNEEERSNTAIVNTVRQCLDNKITKIHCIFFCVALNRNVREEDILSCSLFSEKFVGAERNISLISTRSESLTDEDCERIKKEIKSYAPLKELYDKCNGRLFFMGCLERAKVANGTVKNQLKRVAELRSRLLEHIFSSGDPFDLRQLATFATERKRAQEKFEELKAKVSAVLADAQSDKVACKALIDGFCEDDKKYLDPQQEEDADRILLEWSPHFEHLKNK